MKKMMTVIVVMLAIGCSDNSPGEMTTSPDAGTSCVDGPSGCDGNDGQIGPVGNQGPQGERGPMGLQGARGEQGLQGIQGVAGPQGSAGPTGPQGEQGLGVANCEWCQAGESTYKLLSGTSNQYQIFSCSSDGTQCGAWELYETCQAGWSIRRSTHKIDQYGLPSRFDGPTWECYDPKAIVSSPIPLKSQQIWVSGRGTWTYRSDPSHEWSVINASGYAQCSWEQSTYWHTNASRCSLLYVNGQFDAPEGGLSKVHISFSTDGIFVGTVLQDVVSISTNVTNPDRSGSITYTNRSVTVTNFELHKGGFIEGTWNITGTINTVNVIQASGEFRFTLN